MLMTSAAAFAMEKMCERKKKHKQIRTFYNENHQKLLDSIQSKSKQNKAKTIKEKAKVKKCIWKRMLITNRGRCLITYKKPRIQINVITHKISKLI